MSLAVGLVLGLAAASARTPLQVAVSVAPEAGIVERIGGARVSVEVLVPPDRSPATYEPTPQQLARLSDATMLISIGAPFEETLLPRLARIAPRLPVIDGLAGIERVALERALAAADGHDHGGRPDPHVWLDPRRLEVFAGTVAGALAAADPEGAGSYRERLATLSTALAEVDRAAAARLAPFAGRALLVFHPAYGYLARRYGLRQVAIEVEGRAPSPRQLAAVIELARTEGTRVVLVQPQLADHAARAVADAIGGRLAIVDPLPYDPVAGIRQAADSIAEALADGS